MVNFNELYFNEKTFTNSEAQDYYRKFITEFTDTFGIDLKKLTVPKLNEYLTTELIKSKQGKNYTIKTYERNLNVIRAFLNFLFKYGHIDYNYALHVKRTQQDYSIKTVDLPTIDELFTLINFINTAYENEQSYTALRNLLMFNLTFHSGISNNGLISLKEHSLIKEKEHYYLLVSLPKVKKVAINQTDGALIETLIQLKNEFTDSPHLFISRKTNEGIVKRTVSFFFKKLCKDCNIQSYSSTSFIKAGMLAALVAGYDINKLSYDTSLQKEYLKRRVSYCLQTDEVRSYSDLFNSKPRGETNE